MSKDPIYAHFIEQAGWNEALGSPFTADLIRLMAADYAAKGPVHDLCAGWSGNPRKDAVALRVLGALHHAVLTERAPELEAQFPSAKPRIAAHETWPIARAFLDANRDYVRTFMQSPPQTNETRRAIVLLTGFLELAARYRMPMHLLELGASAGLNLNWDRFSYETDSWSRKGTSDVHIRTIWNGPPPEHLGAVPEISSRAACDMNPLDVSQTADAMRLRAYTWADQADRLARLDAAIALAAETGVGVERADAADWLEPRLAGRPSAGLTVVYHSVFLIYPPKEQIKRIMDLIEAAGAAATEDAPVAWLCYESEALFGGDHTSPRMHARLQTWPGGASRIFAVSDGHVTAVDYLGATG